MPRQSYDILAMLQATRDKSFIQVTMSRFADSTDEHPLAIEHTFQSQGSFDKRRNVMFVTVAELRSLAEQMLMAADDAESTLRQRTAAEKMMKGSGKIVLPTNTLTVK